MITIEACRKEMMIEYGSQHARWPYQFSFETKGRVEPEYEGRHRLGDGHWLTVKTILYRDDPNRLRGGDNHGGPYEDYAEEQIQNGYIPPGVYC